MFYFAESIDFYPPSTWFSWNFYVSRELLSRTDGCLQSIALSSAGFQSEALTGALLQGAGERGLWTGRGTGLETGGDGRQVRAGVYGEGTVPGCWGLPRSTLVLLLDVS